MQKHEENREIEAFRGISDGFQAYVDAEGSLGPPLLGPNGGRALAAHEEGHFAKACARL